MFTPTHLLISRSKETPVQLIPTATGCKLLTEPEFQRDREPAFEFRAKQGFFCQGVSVLGYRLQPLAVEVSAEASPAAIGA